jgi:outer membrane receptor protein involved in Fe transport
VRESRPWYAATTAPLLALAITSLLSPRALAQPAGRDPAPPSSAAPEQHAAVSSAADEAELHFQLGTERYRSGDLNAALEHFLRSNRLVPNRNVVFNIARTFENLKRFADAHRYYVDALAGETDPRAQKDVSAAIARIAPNVAVLNVVTSPPGATLYIDRRDLGSRGRSPRPLALSPGTYRVLAELDGHEPAVSAPITAEIGKTTSISLALKRIVGTVHVDVEGAPGALVREGDERSPPLCSAPCDAELPPGPHLLYFTREGYQATPRQITVAAGRVTRTTAVLSPLTGSLLVSTDEPGAVVIIDGRTMGFTPVVIQSVPAGERQVRIALRDFAPIERAINIRAGEQAELTNIELTPVREVTAVSRYAQAIEEAPSSVTVIDGREIRAFGYPTVAEALRGVRGLSLSNDRAYSSAGIRGVGEPNDYNNRVLLLSDGQPLNENLLNSSYIGSEGRVDLHDIARIEVVRGPGSLLYGAGAFSGVINMVTRPRDEPTQAFFGAGVYDSSALHGRAGFYYNIGRDKGVWASLSGARSDGFSLSVPLADPPANAKASGVEAFRSYTASGRAWWGPLTAQWLVHGRDQSVPIGAYSTRFGDPNTRLHDLRLTGEIRYEPRLSKSLELMTRAHASRFVYSADYAAEPLAFEDFRGTWFGGEARLAFTPRPSLRVTVGGEGQYHPEATLFGRTEASGVSSTYIDAGEPYGLGAAYLLADIKPQPWISFSGGVRVDVYTTFGPIAVPRAAVIVKPARGGVLKLMGGRAFRAPSVYELQYSDGGLSQVPAGDLGPESIYSGELEYSQRFLKNWIALGAVHAGGALGIINTTPLADGSGLIRYENSDVPVLLSGADAEIRHDFRQGFMVSASYGYQLTRYVDPNIANKRLINAPEHLASLRAVVPMVRELASAALRVTLEAPRRISLDDDATTPTSVIGDVAVSGFVRRFGLRYTAGVYNVTDQPWEVPIAGTFASRTMPQNGRTFLLDVTVAYP